MPLSYHAALLMLSAALVPAAWAHDADWVQCARIASALERLDCYDALAEDAEKTTATTFAPDRSTTGERDAPTRATRPTTTLSPVNNFSPGDDRGAPTAGTRFDEFGFPDRLSAATPEEITTRYDGAFTGWSGNTLFRLANGQVWKQSQSGRVTFHRDRPRVSIRKGTFGTYRLSVEGLGKTVRVTRIK